MTPVQDVVIKAIEDSVVALEVVLEGHYELTRDQKFKMQRACMALANRVGLETILSAKKIT